MTKSIGTQVSDEIIGVLTGHSFIESELEMNPAPAEVGPGDGQSASFLTVGWLTLREAVTSTLRQKQRPDER